MNKVFQCQAWNQKGKVKCDFLRNIKEARISVVLNARGQIIQVKHKPNSQNFYRWRFRWYYHFNLWATINWCVGTVTHEATWERQTRLTYIPYSHLNCPPPLWYVAVWGRTFWEPGSGFLANYDKDRLHALPASVLLCFAKSLKPTTLGSEPRAVSVFPGQRAKDNASQSYSSLRRKHNQQICCQGRFVRLAVWDPILKLVQILERKAAISTGRKGMKIKEI